MSKRLSTSTGVDRDARAHGTLRATAFALCLGVFGALAAENAPAATDFQRDIAPILVKRCYECHGPDQQKSKLRLDSRADALKGGKSGKPVLVPGKPDESELLVRTTSADPDEVMPPKGDRLTVEQVAALRTWIENGAPWVDNDPRRHWAFVAPRRHELPVGPVGAGAQLPLNAIDSFIFARLATEGLAPSPPADRYTLIRRVSLDLTGLPPSWSEVEAFFYDSRPDAYERLVDRLLASPHYGEHIASWWLDLARYADSNGYQVDLARSVWPYRDWVINAFNRNQPFDQFTIEQLAGDLLPNATLEQRVATGFNRNTKINDEGGGDAEEYRTKAVKDRVATTATTWLGLTMMCAECHTHKYDPISHEEYYRFYALFNSTSDGGNYSLDPTVPVPPPDVSRRLGHLRERLAQTKRDLALAERQLPAEQAGWERRLTGRTNLWIPLTLEHAVSTGGATYTNLPDGSLLATGANPIFDTILVEAETTLVGITAVLLEVLPDPSLPKNGPGRWGQTGNFILDEFAAWAVPSSPNPGAPQAPRESGSTNLVFARAEADWEQQYYRAEHAVDRNPKTGWAIGPRFGERHFLIAELADPTGFANGTRLGFRFEHYHGNSHTLGRFRISVTTERDPLARWPVAPGVLSLVAIPAADRTPEQQRQIAAQFRAVAPSIRRLEHELFRLNQRESELAATRYSTLVMQELARPRETYIHARGNFLEKGKVVTPGVPEILPPLPADQPTNRLALARWLVSPENPLTARVTVNRLWERFFGTGLVKTSDDFGRQGEVPSHPELLDWLATDFVRTGWDVKAMQKLLVMSATYRQSAVATDTLLEKDYYNRLLARGPRFRLTAEMVRDQALTVSGLLNRDLGGPSVYPVQVANLWKEIGFLRPEIGMDEWPVSEGPDLYRRGVYTFWRRVCTYPTLATFDAPSRDVCTARRPRTNTPLQALAGLNEPTLFEAAQAFARRILTEGGSNPAAQLDFAFRNCLGRPPTEAEQRRLLSFVEQQTQSYERDPAAAAALVTAGSTARPSSPDAQRLAAWTMVANALFNLDETLTKG